MRLRLGPWPFGTLLGSALLLRAGRVGRGGGCCALILVKVASVGRGMGVVRRRAVPVGVFSAANISDLKLL